MTETTIALTVRALDFAAKDVLVLDLAAQDELELPAWAPGAHIDLVLASGKVRQYSLCGDPADRSRYRIAVLQESNGRGGSVELHAMAAPGLCVSARGPRNHFQLVDAPAYLFVAGGIGITPILPMIRAAELVGRPWRLVYGGRSRATMGFLSEIAERRGGEVTLMPQDEVGMPDLDRLFATLEPGTLVYGCGPEGMLKALEAAAKSHGTPASLHIERFGAADGAAAAVDRSGDEPFEVELRQTGIVLQVPADRSLGSVLQDADAPVPFSCQEGYCGSCETKVLEGVPDHRDTILNDAEKAEGKIMMVCVGRARTARLVLDL